MTEIWRPVPGYEDSHEVSSLGRIRSIDRVTQRMNRWGKLNDYRKKGRLLNGGRFPNGYRGVVFKRGGKCYLVHRLVAEAFIPNPDTLREVNHKNGIKWDNRLTNLEWVSSSDNKFHSYRELERKQHAKTIPVTISRSGEVIAFPSELAAAKYLGVVAGSIRSALKRDHLCRGWRVDRAKEAA